MKLIARTLIWISVFAVTFALVEATVVVYLRALYYPDGFAFPLRLVTLEHLRIELMREAATIGMLVSMAAIAGKKRWEQFGYFIVAFGLWDIFYYVWLKVFTGWPATLIDWDVLFLLPLPWIGPVIAPVLIAVVMVVCGVLLLERLQSGKHFAPTLIPWSIAIAGTAVVLYSFVYDIQATLRMAEPQPYRYGLLATGLLLYVLSFWTSCRAPAANRN